ncbi:hypothetical protein ARMGADRAFT_1037212 [Armillaria gallica]|uniref:Uncharacterized protein n=1 Tax=Armillaria gallica TaxID=47427 RepID=A0A2H3D9X2_ARMGA|nr:hypothetical protein ARMGADRAFT_1037212 [Armillaria gallica]
MAVENVIRRVLVKLEVIDKPVAVGSSGDEELSEGVVLFYGSFDLVDGVPDEEEEEGIKYMPSILISNPQDVPVVHSDIILTRSDHSLNEDVKQLVTVKLNNYIDPSSRSMTLNKSTSPQGLCMMWLMDTSICEGGQIKCATKPFEELTKLLVLELMGAWNVFVEGLQPFAAYTSMEKDGHMGCKLMDTGWESQS